jgi:CPA1 family monovalent cation:H+ antiporter
MSVPVILLVVAGLLVTVSLVQRLAARLALPASVLFALVGTAIGAAALFALRDGATGAVADVARAFVDVPVSADTFLYVFVPALLFQSSLTVDVRRIIEDAAPIFLLAVVAVLVATAIIGIALVPLAGVSVVACLLLASIVATTDSVAVIGIFREVGAPGRLCRLVEGESLLNDAAAIVTFTVLLEMATGGASAGVVGPVVEFLWALIGGMAVGYLATWIAVVVMVWLRDLRLAQVTLTLALPYLVYIIGERALGVSGVTAAVTSGLAMAAIGPQRIQPSDWRFLLDMWEQLAYWASSLIFVLAALLVPGLLLDIGWHDVLVLAVEITAALGARALVLWGFLPLLSRLHMSQHVGTSYKVVILWGGLRGAVTLALALAVTENTAISHDVQRFVAVQATGFVLFTLLVQGLTLRPLIQWLQLDRLSPFDEALRTQVLAISRSRIADAVRTIGKRYRFSDELVTRVADTYRPTDPAPNVTADGAGPTVGPTAPSPLASDDEHLRLGLVALVQREREIVLEHFDARTISGRTVEELLGDVAQLLDHVRTRGEAEYLRTGQTLVGFSRPFRVAHLVHRHLHIDGPLVDRLADRFERLLVSRIVLEELAPYITETLAPLVNERTLPKLADLLQRRQAMATAALDALGAQYPEYAALLEQRFLRRLALRREDLEYRALFEEGIIGPELYAVLQREVQTARERLQQRPSLDLGLETRTLIKRVPMFAALADADAAAVARLLRPRFAVPDERLIRAGDAGDAMYFISSGVVDVDAAGRHILLMTGDFFGEMALVSHRPRGADVTARMYCQLLVLERRDFQALVRGNKAIREQITKAADERREMNANVGADAGSS